MKITRLVFPKKHTIEIEQAEIADNPGAGEVLVENTWSIISPGTELAMFTESHVGFAVPEFAWAKFPFHPGYAAVGRALRVGEGVKDIKEGDLVIHGGPHASHGMGQAWKVPAGFPERLAPFTFLAEIALTSVFAGHPQVGQDAAVLGQGMVGNLAAQWMQVAGARRVIAIDTVPSRLTTSKRCGLSLAVNPKETDVIAEVKRLTGEVGCQVVIEATGSPEATKTALKLAAKAGKVVVLSSPRGSANIELYWEIHRTGVSLIGAHGNHLKTFAWPGLPDSIALSLEYLAAGRLAVEPMVTHALPASEAKSAFDGLLYRPAGHLGVLLDLTRW